MHNLANEYGINISKFYCIGMQKGLAVVAISSNSVVTHPQVLITALFEIRAIMKLLSGLICSKWNCFCRMGQCSWQKRLKCLITHFPIYMMRYTSDTYPKR